MIMKGQNQFFEGKLENQEINAKIREITEGSSVEKLKEENRTLLKKLKEAEEREQIANDKVNCIMG
jgi:hypothetical protein